MSIDRDRLEVTYSDAGLGGSLLDFVTVGLVGIVEDAIEGDNHGWWCHIKDIITEVEHKEWGKNKIEAYQKALKTIIPKIETFEIEKKRKQDELKRQQEELKRIQEKKAEEERKEIERIEKERRKQTIKSEGDDGDLTLFFVKAGFAIAAVVAAIWFLFNVAVPILVMNAAILLLILSFIISKYKKYFLIGSVAGIAYIILDMNMGWFTSSLPQNISFFQETIPYFYYGNIIGGLISAFLLIKILAESLNNNNSISQNFSSILKSSFSNTEVLNTELPANEVSVIKSQSLVAVGLLLISIIMFAYFAFNGNNNINTYNNNFSYEEAAPVEETPVEQVNEVEIGEAPPAEINNNSDVNNVSDNQSNYLEKYKKIIADFYQLESRRNFDALYNSYLRNFTQYYDLYNPSYNVLQKRFENAWNVTYDVSNSIKSFDLLPVENMTDIYVTLDYTYTGTKTQERKTVHDIKLIFSFDVNDKLYSITENKN
jgi:hypothetical protein